MEGRQPPPHASHPFPNNPDLTKFWGTPRVKAYAKAMSVMLTAGFSLIGVLLYVTRNEQTMFGFKIETPTREEMEKKRDMKKGAAKIMNLPIPVEMRHQSFEKGMMFDDGVSFIPPDTPYSKGHEA